ncbi:MAG TPA: hypothetical protein VFM16_02865 [Holophagaceae bacterium]|nr:hypothetical protein [Holophagaceae bacterium]
MTLIYPELAAFMQGGVSIMVASRGIQNIPSAVRALGCRVLPGQASGQPSGQAPGQAPGRDRIRVLVPVPQCRALLQDIRATGRVAVVFSKPTTHQALQFKAEDALVAALEEADLAAVEAYRIAMSAEIQLVGFPPESAQALLSCAPADLAPIVFTPEAGFVQTPGPDAGAPMPGRPEGTRP